MNFQEFKSVYEKKKVEAINNLPSSKPLVSVCVQTYQHGPYIGSCLESIVNQNTNFEFEILLGEDNSNDETREICIEYAKKYPGKIKLFLHHRENQINIMGEPTSNFNAFYNFFSAKGNYIAFCEGDDIWCDPFKLQKQVDFLENSPDYIFTYHSFSSINSSGETFVNDQDEHQPHIDISSEELLKLRYHPLLLCTCFRNNLKEIPLQMTQVINVDSFLFSLLGKYGKAKFIEDIEPAKYRKHSGGIWSKRNQQRKFLSKIITFQKLVDYYEIEKNMELVLVFNKKLKESFKTLIYKMVKAGEILSAIKTTALFFKTIK